jgi:fumarate reductase flavoprotein subunit
MSDVYDVIVVGAGGSGLAAACSAAERGANVLVLEKQPQPGGTTGIAVGSFTAAGTRLQRAAGIDDRPQEHAEDAAQFARPEIEAHNHAELRAWFLREAAATLDWLESLGLSFVGPSPEPPNRVPRMHNVVPGAKAYIAALQLALQRRGGSLVCGAAVTGLLREGERVVGVRAEVAGQAREIRARRGVILAAGDYANNPDVIAKHLGEQFRAIEGINPFACGDGHRLAEDAGARLVNMQLAYGPELRFVPSSRRPFQQWLPAGGAWSRVMGAVARRLPGWAMRRLIKRLLVTWQHPETALFDDGAMLLNRRGERFVNERDWPQREIAVAAQPDKLAYILLDGRLIERYSAWPHFISTAPDIAYAYVRDYQRLRPDVTQVAPTLAEAARLAKLDAGAVERSVAEFNASVAGDQADPYGRAGDEDPLERSPWLLLGPVKAYFTTTEGGAAVNQRLQVLDERGRPIPGLFAVGQNGLGGMVLWGHGLHIAWAMTSGRLAGRFVTEEP